MKVLFVYKFLTLGGVETVLRARLEGLAERGIEAHAWFFDDLGGRALFASSSDRVSVGPVDAMVERARTEFDLVATIDTPEMLPRWNERADRPALIVECHTPYRENLAYLSTLEARAVRALLVPSRYQSQVVRARLRQPIPIHVVPNPLHASFLGPISPFAPTPPRPVIAWVGRLDDLKDWRTFLRIGARVLSEVEVELWLAGTPVDRGAAKELENEARSARVLHRLRWYRALPHDRVARLCDAVRESGGLVMSTSRGESFGMTVAEAMARECAVLVPDRPPLTELVSAGSTGELFPPGDVGEAADRAVRLLASAERRRALGAGARSYVMARFTPDAALPSLARTLRGIVGNGH